ncbi:MAG TPA: hypothetical protein VNT26_02265, partial [Candidatus Sulfotelmatobacter sp.]|nr:hypothetical protein [Candidatus Sulfotelmatobacter sp.]
MSEYQYYEFQAVDRPLTPEEQDKVASLSSRVQLTASSAVFTYNFGDFRGNPERILEAYYDAMLYLANWGSKQLLFRLPRKLVQLADLQPYCVEDVVSTRQSGDYAILNIRVDEEEPDGWREGEGCLAPLLPIRQMLLEGDFRALYLAWLKGAQRTDPDGEEAEALEPPVPPNLKKLTPPLRALVEFFDVDPDLIAVAAETSPTQPEGGPVDYPALLPKL